MRGSLRFGLLLMTSALAINAAVGQEAVQLDEVVVETAAEKGDGPVKGYVAKQSKAGTKTDTPIARTSQSVSVVSSEQMEDQQVESVAEALRYTPGVFTEYRGASNLRDEVFVRGFYYVPRYLDGLFLGGDLSYAQVNPYLLERVELLSGPSSVLYGQANPGGIINMVSKKPTDQPLHEIGITVGDAPYFSTFFDFSDKVKGSETLSYRVAGIGLGGDLQEEFAKQKAFAIAPSITWTPSVDTTLTVLGGVQHEPDAGFRNFLDAAGTVFPIEGYGYVPRDFFVSDPDFEKFTRDQAWIGYEFEHRFNDAFTVRQNARFHHIDMEHHTLVWGWTSPDPVTGANTIVHRAARGGTDRWNQFTIDNQVKANFSTGPAEHTLLAGLDYRYRARDYVWGDFGSVPTISLTDPVYGGFDYSALAISPFDDQNLVAKQTGLYLQDQVELGGLNLSAGLRYDWSSTDIDDHLAGTTQSYDDSALTWRLGALYAFNNGIAPYASYSTSFEPALQTPPAGEDPFSPMRAEQYEVGVKYAPEGSNMLFTAAYYDLRQNDVVMGAWDPVNFVTVYSQIGEIRSRGFEFSAHSEINDNLKLIAAYSYTDSKIEETVEPTELGKTPARVPEHQASLWSIYSFNTGSLEGLSLGGGVRYIGKSYGDNANSFTVPSATLFDASISYDFGVKNPEWSGLKLQINAKNIADKRYVASCASAYACFYGEGRSITATLKKSW
ncbi:MAG: TonB-dependent siderophore receptor [Mesorhizobium sp.]